MVKRILLMIMVVSILFPAASAHPGRTDAAGGHHVTATGEYHYHHGKPAHDHPGGVCPYEDKPVSVSSNSKDIGADKSEEWKEIGKKEAAAQYGKQVKDLWTGIIAVSVVIVVLMAFCILALKRIRTLKRTNELLQDSAQMYAEKLRQAELQKKIFDTKKEQEYQQKLAIAENELETKVAWYEKQRTGWEVANQIRLMKAQSDVEYRKTTCAELLRTMKELQALLSEYRKLRAREHTKGQLFFDDSLLLEKEAQIKDKEHELLKFRRPEIIANMPEDTEIGKDNLPREIQEGNDKSWGKKYTFYKASRGHIYHRWNCPCNATDRINAAQISQSLTPCKRCNPELPDLTWYRIYLEDLKFMQEIEQDALHDED